MKTLRAFTILELTIALLVVLLVAVIVFPVLARAKRSGHRAGSVANLRQIGHAIELYRSDHDGGSPFLHLDPFVTAGYLDDRVLRSGNDRFQTGYGKAMSACTDGPQATDVETSYEDAFVSQSFFERLRAVDPDAAIVADRTNGTVSYDKDETCDRIHYYYSGVIHRLFEDTHVRTAQYSFVAQGAPENVGRFWSRFSLFTDKDHLKSSLHEDHLGTQ